MKLGSDGARLRAPSNPSVLLLLLLLRAVLVLDNPPPDDFAIVVITLLPKDPFFALLAGAGETYIVRLGRLGTCDGLAGASGGAHRSSARRASALSATTTTVGHCPFRDIVFTDGSGSVTLRLPEVTGPRGAIRKDESCDNDSSARKDPHGGSPSGLVSLKRPFFHYPLRAGSPLLARRILITTSGEQNILTTQRCAKLYALLQFCQGP